MTLSVSSNAAVRRTVTRFGSISAVAALLVTAACASSRSAVVTSTAVATAGAPMQAGPPSPDPRTGLGAGLMNAEEAVWNLRVLSKTPPPAEFVGMTNSDLAFTGNYAIQGSYNGFQVWDISNPAQPTLAEGFVCPASQSDVSVYRNLLFVSGEGLGGRIDCGTAGVPQSVSADRLRGIRIFDISDVHNPKYITNVQTCRGSHTHSVLADPDDRENVYIYVSGSAPVRPAEELPGCSGMSPDEDPNSALFRIEVIRVPLANPAQAAIVSSPRIFNDLVAPPTHGMAPEDLAEFTAAKLDSIMKARGGSGVPTAADSSALRAALPAMLEQMTGQAAPSDGPQPGPTQCHDITLYPGIDRAGGACEGYGLLLDISDPANPVRLAAVADSNFSYWHSATFNNDGSKVLFSDEWGGGGQPKCRASDPYAWGADAIFTIENGEMKFQSYYKLPAAQTPMENCVAHNGSLIPIPGRDVMVQAWYQGGISVFDWTDPAHPVEIAYHDRGPIDSTRMQMGGSWSVYWYNGRIVSSEIARGLDIFELVPSAYLTRNEIEAANTIELDYLNAQGQPQYVWPPSFALARAYLDQLDRSNGLMPNRIGALRDQLRDIERQTGAVRRDALTQLALDLDQDIPGSRDAPKARMLTRALRDLAAASF